MTQYRVGFAIFKAAWLGFLAGGLPACTVDGSAPAQAMAVGGAAAGAGVLVYAGATGIAAGGSLASAGGMSFASLGSAGAPNAQAGAGGSPLSFGGASGGSAGSASDNGAPALPGALGKFEPPDGQTLLVIGQDTASIEEYASSVTPMPAGVMLYTNISDLAGIASATSFGAGEDDLQHWAANPAQFVVQIGLLLKDVLPDIASGALDGNIDQLADLLQASKRPVFLRVGYEFDSDWANYEPNAYKAAFQHLVDRFRQKGTDNVMFVWHAWGYQHSFGQSTVLPWYPGDGYVDWVGVSLFPGWDNASIQAAGAAREEISTFAQQHQKPFMIAESAPKQQYQPSLGVSSWTDWYAPVFAFITSHNVKLFSYINADWDAQPLWTGQGWGDTRVQTNDYVLSQWRMQMAGSRFLQASTHLYPPL